MAKLLYKLGMGTYRRRLPVVLIWLLVLIGTGVGAFTLGGETSNSMSIPGQESTTALERIQEKFGSGETASAKVVVQAPDGQTLPQHVKAITDLVADESALKGVRSATNPLDPAAPSVNRDVNVGYSTVTYDVKPGEVTAEQRAELTKAVDKARAAGLTVEVTGTAMQETPHVGGPTEAIGVVLALVVLALTYGSLVTAGMNLLSAGIGVGIGTLGITIATGFMDLQSTTPILASMLGLAVGIDYALFIINRYRQELRRGSSVGHAVATAVGTAGSAVVTAGLTVVIALVGLAIAGIPFLTQMGVSAAATIVVSVLIAITLVPAVLSLLGRRVLTRKERAAEASEPKDRGVIRAWGGAITRNRVVALLFSVVALGIVAIPVTSMDTTLIQKPPAGSTQERADQILAKGFGEGFNGPIIVLFEGEGAAATATEASKPIAQLSDVALVTPAQPSQDGKSALVTVIPKSGPDTVETEKLVADLRAELSGVDGGKAYVTGATAVSVDVATSLDKALPIYLAVVVGLALVLLVLVFRSLLVPLVGVLGFLLTIGASLGATVAVFQWGWLSGAVNLDSTGPLISLTPILVIGILFGLAMDYQIFLVSRMHEAHHRGAKPIEAITTGFRQAAPVVVAAALIMFSVFAGFVPAGEATVKSIAFALAVGIFVDAFVVRMVLVPAALALLGERAWWLPKFLRWLPELDVEGTALDEIEKKDRQEPVSVG
ncbi:MMPL family transporter [Lentzea flaviverrucosa]|uniref:Putative drug exporter of the RND superfamily n=1 Tax=Lentzea flaviverrucosa TaxID=200379 RepID=A0A1H9FLE3_9PSEU|nr:MMPL family transporter [Lentzea flaviverrucosa]RDI35163.1 RND superfamily putative drug exporter [Lentzea flaviverrucosa]SEQ38747.1 putative drug exporter of the RND superfamily [Lentzea flaviverrucosa]